MKLLKPGVKPTPAEYIAAQCASGRPWQDEEDDLDILVRLVQLIRPRKPSAVEQVDISHFISFLRQYPDCAAQLSGYVLSVVGGRRFAHFLSDAGIPQDTDFFHELRKRVVAKFLPFLPAKDRLDFVLNQVFYLATDFIWVRKIPKEQLEELFEALHFPTLYENDPSQSALSEVMTAMNLIMQRVSGRAMETDVVKMVPEFDGLESPFTAFEVELFEIEERIRAGKKPLAPDDLSYRQLEVLHHQCHDFVNKAFANSAKYGISMRVNQNLLKIRLQLERIGKLMPFLTATSARQERSHTIALALELIRYNCYKNNIRMFIADSTQLISYEITQHTAKTGEHYITEGKGDYFRMFRAALGGGLVVGLLCLLKVLLSKVDTSLFGHAFYYSMNYAFGFITIYLLGFTLATKQPAMTASALIRALEVGMTAGGKSSEKHEVFAAFFARVFRSQFIAFLGNVMMAFPVAWGLIYAFESLFGFNPAEGKPALLMDISPWHSPALLHAAIAGVFLFLSGIISGSVANRDKHEQVYFRIAENPIFKKWFGRRRTADLAKWYERRWAGIVSNFWFGVFMGSTASIGWFLGLNLDVRHITFASGNLALGLYGNGFRVEQEVLVWCLAGIVVIGLVNFLVSFSLSMGLAFRSRDIPLLELRSVAASTWRYFLRHPLRFFFPTEGKKPVEASKNVKPETAEPV